MSELDYSAVVVTYRRPDSLARVLESLANQSNPPLLVVVADNDPDRSAEAVVATSAAQAPGLQHRYLPMGANLGPAGGWARGAKAARAEPSHGTWLLVVDDDDPLGHPALVEHLLSEAMRSPGRSCGAIGLRGAQLDRRWARLHRATTTSAERVDYLASGGVPLYRWDAIDEVGFFDERLFFGFEDLDLGLRMTAAGWQLLTAPRDELHQVADSAAIKSPWREYYKTRALVHIARSQLDSVAVASVMLRSVVIGSLILLIRERDLRPARARWEGAIDAVRGRMGPNGHEPEVNAPKEYDGGERVDVLFVSGVDVGGAPRSTLELAEALRARGRSTEVLLGRRPEPSSALGVAERLALRARRTPGLRGLWSVFRWTMARTGRRLQPSVRRAPFVEHAIGPLVETLRPRVVVANSLSRSALAAIDAELRRQSVPLVLYLREAQALNHLASWGLRPTLVVANSHELAAAARDLGVDCFVVPSAIDLDGCVATTSRTTLLMVNPIAENMPEVAFAIAAARPDIPVVLQESWPLPPAALASLRARANALPNVEIRRSESERSAVYRDARLLLATYPSGRPRVVVEAQANEVPCVAAAQPSLREAVGDAGGFVELEAPTRAWIDAVAEIWDDPDRYDELRQRCRTRVASGSTSPHQVAKVFDDFLTRVMS